MFLCCLGRFSQFCKLLCRFTPRIGGGGVGGRGGYFKNSDRGLRAEP